MAFEVALAGFLASSQSVSDIIDETASIDLVDLVS